MIRSALVLIFLTSLLFRANAQSDVDKQQIIGQLRRLRNAMSVGSVDVSFEQYQNKCRALLNAAILKIDSRENGFPYQYLNSLSVLNALARRMPDVSAAEKNKVIRLLYADLVLK